MMQLLKKMKMKAHWSLNIKMSKRYIHTNPDDREQETHFVRMQVMSFLLHLLFRIPCCTNCLVEY